MKRTLILIITLALLGSGLPSIGAQDSQANQPVPQRYQGRIAALSGPGAGGTAFLTFQVDRFAPDSEVQTLAKTLGEQGEEALLKAVAATEVAGWVRVGNGLRYNLRVIRSMDTPDGRVVIGITDRAIQIGEVTQNRRSAKYAFGWVQLLFDAEGKGQGSMIPTAKINFDKDGRLVVESFGTQPYQIMKVLPQPIK